MTACDGKKRDCSEAVIAGGWCIFSINGQCASMIKEAQTNGTNA